MSIFSTVADFLKPAPLLDPSIHKALDRVAELVDPLLKITPGFERKLSAPLQHALGYCDGLVATLPGPIEISRHAFSTDPLIHALFATANDIDQMLGRSQEIRDFLASPCSWESEHFYAMFAARRQEKRQLGMARQGDVIRSDVSQTVLYFSNQTLIEPHCQLDDARRALRCTTLESLLRTFHSHVDVLRHERDGLRADLSIERAHLTILSGSSGGQAYQVHTRHVTELNAELHTRAEALMPDQMLEALAAYLQAPEPALHLTPVSITVDRLGVVQNEPADGLNAHTLNFPELTARDRRLHLAMLVRISREEALEAVEMVRDQQHRFILI